MFQKKVRMRDCRLGLGQQFRDVPDAVSDSGLQSGRDAQRYMDTAEIVVGEVQAARGPQVFLLAREAIG